MESIKKVVGDNLKSVCKIKGIKNKEIADFIGVTESCVSNWFRGKNSLDIDNLYNICSFIGVSLDQIFGIEPIIYGALTDHENNLILAYRNADPGIQASINKLLDLKEKNTKSEVG